VTLPLVRWAAPVLVFAAASAQADDGAVARGEKAFQYCFSCHSVEPAETNLEGPNLRGIFGRKIASQEGFKYSPAMRALAQRYERWSEQLLDRYMMQPEALVPKNSMNFNGLDDAAERADLIAYLRATGVSP